jgi:hypothetical protein
LGSQSNLRGSQSNLRGSQTNLSRRGSFTGGLPSKGPVLPTISTMNLADDLLRRANEIQMPEARIFDWQSTSPLRLASAPAPSENKPDYNAVNFARPADDGDPDGLSLSVEGNQIVFNRYPYTKDLLLKNNSAMQTAQFRIQASPRRYFTVSPAYGSIEKGDTITVRVTFHPNAYRSKPEADVQGYLRLRLCDGTTVER